jgi:hypothetical protein
MALVALVVVSKPFSEELANLLSAQAFAFVESLQWWPCSAAYPERLTLLPL